MKETQLQSKIMRDLRKLDIFILDTHRIANNSGCPDFFVFYNGLILAFELKMNNNKLSAAQEKWKKKFKEANKLPYYFVITYNEKNRTFKIFNYMFDKYSVLIEFLYDLASMKLKDLTYWHEKWKKYICK